MNRLPEEHACRELGRLGRPVRWKPIVILVIRLLIVLVGASLLLTFGAT